MPRRNPDEDQAYLLSVRWLVFWRAAQSFLLLLAVISQALLYIDRIDKRVVLTLFFILITLSFLCREKRLKHARNCQTIFHHARDDS